MSLRLPKLWPAVMVCLLSPAIRAQDPSAAPDMDSRRRCQTVPAVPTGLSSPGQTPSTIHLTWSAVSAPRRCAVTYTIYKGGSVVASGLTGTSLNVTGLSAGTTYRFTVAAVDGAGASAPSTVLAVSTLPGGVCTVPPATPVGLASPSQTGTSVNLSWAPVSAPAGCSLTYSIYQNGTLVLTVPTTTAIISGLTANTTYAFAVAAVDSAGTSPQSLPLSVRTPAGGTPTPAQVLAALTSQMIPAKQVNKEPHINTMTRAQNVNVYQVIPGVFAFTSSMAIDDDGSDPNPDPDHQDQTDCQTTDGKFLGAAHVPYLVLGDVCYDGQSPCKWFYYAEHDISCLQFILVFYNGKAVGAVFGDTQGPPGGDARELGEASVMTASLLGIPDSGTTGGVTGGVTYVVFSGPQWVLTGTNSTLNANAQALVGKALATLASGLGLSSSQP